MPYIHNLEISFKVLHAVRDKLKASRSASKAKLVGNMNVKIQIDGRKGVYYKMAAKRYNIELKKEDSKDDDDCGSYTDDPVGLGPSTSGQ